MVKTPRPCKVCSSANRVAYEKLYYKAKGKISMYRLAEIAKENFDEEISRKSFERHFHNNHYSPESIQKLLDKGVIDSQVEKARSETIDILDEIKANLMGLKGLIGSTQKSKSLGDVVAVYREVRLTLQDIERLREKLSSSTSLTKAELYKEIFWACSVLCPECREIFWVRLDERLRKKGYT